MHGSDEAVAKRLEAYADGLDSPSALPTGTNELLRLSVSDQVTCNGPYETVAKTTDTCADGLSSPSGPQVAQKNFLRLSPPDPVICDGSDDPSPHKASEGSEPHSRGRADFCNGPDGPCHTALRKCPRHPPSEDLIFLQQSLMSAPQTQFFHIFLRPGKPCSHNHEHRRWGTFMNELELLRTIQQWRKTHGTRSY
jgi:hypothetical protein